MRDAEVADEAAQPGSPSRTGWALLGFCLLLTARLVDRLAGRVALRPAVVRALAAVARPEVRIGERWCRRDRQSGHREDRCKRLTPHATTSFGMAQPFPHEAAHSILAAFPESAKCAHFGPPKERKMRAFTRLTNGVETTVSDTP